MNRLTRIRIFFFCLLGPVILALAACHKKTDDGRSAEQREKAARTDENAKKGALRQKDDPAADLKKQEKNLARLERNIVLDREAGNRVGAWAAGGDRDRVKKLIEHDRTILESAREERR